jgi:membrane protease YdiL (CAAX protease family)
MTDSSTPADKPEVGPVKATWVAPLTLAGMAVLFYAAQIAAAMVLVLIGHAQGVAQKDMDAWLQSSVGRQFFYLILSETLILAGIYGLMRLLRWSRRTIGLNRPKLKYFVIGLAALVPYYIIYLLVVSVAQHLFTGLDVNQKQEVGFDNAVGAGQLIITFVGLVIVPPIVEEIAMRGFLYSGLRTWLPKVIAALVVSVAFGAAHLGEGSDGLLWIGAIDTFVLSMVLVYLREKTGSLWSGITLHGLKNLVAFLLIFVLHVS